jgi:hypothetical protein
MPFTLSHTLAIYPFRKFCGKYLSFSGLFMGSMVPDFEFFFRVTLYAVWSHTFWGVFLFDLPLALLLLLIFHQWTKKALILHLPTFLFQRFFNRIDENWWLFFKKSLFKVIISILIGIFTHFAWDNFTHEPNYISPIYFNFLESDLNIFSIKIKFYQSILEGYINPSELWTNDDTILSLKSKIDSVSDNDKEKIDQNEEVCTSYRVLSELVVLIILITMSSIKMN